jgi:ABC-2 type transport system permease protein
MHNTLRVMRYELSRTLRNPGFLIFAFVIPVAAVLLQAGIRLAQGRSAAGGQGTPVSSPAQVEMAVEGYVDQSGLIRRLPVDIPAGKLRRFESEQQAQQALQAGEITAYYLVPPDYIVRGRVYYVYPDARSYLSDGQSWVMAWTLMFNLLGEDAELAGSVGNPVREVTATQVAAQAGPGSPSGEDCSRPGAACPSNDLVRLMPSLLVVVFFFAFMSSSSRLFNSIGTEKENRVIEVLLLSVSPRQLLAGKTLGLGIAGLLQALAWLAAVYFSFNGNRSLFHLPEDFVFPAAILFWGMLFFLGGYGVYASLMAGAGALVPGLKEAGVASYLAQAPLFFGYIFGGIAPLAGISDSLFLVFLSIFPLTSPVVMVMRLTAGLVPVWQLLLSMVLLFGSVYLTQRLAASMFHAQNLLSGQPFSVRRYFASMLGRH